MDEIIKTTNKKCFKCEEVGYFYFDVGNDDLFCKHCGWRIKFREYNDRLHGSPEKLEAFIKSLQISEPGKIQPDTPEPAPPAPETKIIQKTGGSKMSKKGNCPGCGRSDVALVSHGFCGACYPYARKVKWDVSKVIEWRKSRPVIIRSPKGTRKEKIIKKFNRDIPPVPVQTPVGQRPRTWLDIQIEEQVSRLQETLKGSGFRRAKIEAIVEITIKDVKVSLIP
jgi:hypothetical protein